MRTDNPGGSFELEWERCRAHFNEAGEFVYGSYKFTRNGKAESCAVSSKHVRVIAWLRQQGEQEYSLIQRGILKRK